MLKTLVIDSPLFSCTEIIVDHIVAIQLHLDQKVISIYMTSNINFNIPFETEEDTLKAYDITKNAIQGKI
jgi:hypothetical protein